ncbi:LysR family transcriptional regulator [Undibacterium curvum]|uniref:LysR family transcriptional regulator n=1 Tax=Undibacterium curvum TaxID=2762294 RepID=A0ABR7A518_9BURK|nr:LysR family transcriptional regulator [Undibacterium curvum]MBC3931999.1 LysR family transcriptional regulator [Undibacterium curvum]
MLPLDPLDVEIVLLLNTELSLGRIARRLSMTTSAISQRIERMEDRLGHRIATRKRNIRLTEAGMEVLRTATHLKMHSDDLARRLDQLKNPSIKIMADHSLLIHDLPLVLQQMTSDIPKLSIHLTTGSFNQIIQAVNDHQADAGLIAGDPKVIGLQGRPIRKEHICLLIPNNHPLIRYKTLYFADAIRYPMILSNNLEHITGHLMDEAKRIGAHLHIPMTVPHFEIQAHMVSRTDIGIAPTLESVAKRFISIYPVTYVRLLDDWAENLLSAVIREKGSLSDEVNTLIKYLIKLNH